jgi:hypothetical protein
LEEIILSDKESNKYIILDYYNDTFPLIIQKIEELNLTKINSIGLLRHGYIFSTYQVIDKQSIPSILFDVEVKDPNLDSWTELKNFLLYLVYNFSIKNFDFLSCRLDKNKDYQYVFKKLESKLNINIRAPSDNLGNLINGGTWIAGSENIKNVYFNDNIFNYPYLFFIQVLTIEANIITKIYDLIPYNSPTVLYDGFINNDTISSLIGSLNFEGTYLNAINVGYYTIIPYGFTSNDYYINYINGSITINPIDLVISIRNYVKIYDGTNILNDFDNRNNPCATCA